MLISNSSPLFLSDSPTQSSFVNAFLDIHSYSREYRWINRAIEIEASRNQNERVFATSILENMGFDKDSSSPITRLISALNTGEVSFESVSKTSELGCVLREFKIREKAFSKIAQHKTFTSDEFFNDVAYTLSSQLIKKSKSQALRAVQKVEADNHAFVQSVLNDISWVAQRFLNIFSHLDRKFLTFPTAAATEEFFPFDFSEEEENTLKNLVKSVTETNKIEVKKASGKKLIFFSGFTGAGKGTLINYLFSTQCEMSVIDLTCDTEVVLTSSARQSNTSTLKVIDINGELNKFFDQNTVFVDTPGFHDTRNNVLESFVYLLSASKYIQEMKRNPHINIYVIEFSSLGTPRGLNFMEIKRIIEEESTGDRLIVISKIPTKKEVENTRSKFDNFPSKEKITKAFEEEKFSELLIRNIFLYSIEDAEIADRCVIEKKRYQCFNGGGTNREELLTILRKKVNSAQSCEVNPIIDSGLESLLHKLEEEIKKTLEDGFGHDANSCDFNEMIRKFSQFEILLNIQHPALVKIRNEIFDRIEKKINWIESQIFKLASRELDSDDLIECIFDHIRWIEKFKTIRFFSSKFNVDQTIEKIHEVILHKCHEKFDEIIKAPSTWQENSVIHRFKRMLKLEDLNLKNRASEFYNKLESEYYEYLSTCRFTDANSKLALFNNFKILSKNVGLKFQERLLASSDILEQEYISIQKREEQRLIVEGLGSIALTSLGIMFPGSTFLIDQAVVLVGDAIVNSADQYYYPILCREAWVKTKFHEKIPQEFNPSWE